MACQCGPEWTLHAVTPGTGPTGRCVTRTLLDATSIDLQTCLSAPGKGTVEIPADAHHVADVWPNLTVIVAVLDGRPVWAGLVREIQLDGDPQGGTIRAGCVTVDGYLGLRIPDFPVGLHGPQTQVGADLVGFQNIDGDGMSCLTGSADATSVTASVTWDTPCVGDRTIADLIAGLVGLPDGPEYRLEIGGDQTGWTFDVRFADRVGAPETRRVTDLYGVSIGVDGTSQTTRVLATGQTEPDAVCPPGCVAHTPTGRLRLDVTVTSQIGSDLATLCAVAQGHLDANRDPAADVSVTVPYDTVVGLGDRVDVDVCAGRSRLAGQAKVGCLRWSASVGQPTALQVDLQPVDAAASLLNTTPCPCEDCPPPVGGPP